MAPIKTISKTVVFDKSIVKILPFVKIMIAAINPNKIDNALYLLIVSLRKIAAKIDINAGHKY
jgi:hypothetical protein